MGSKYHPKLYHPDTAAALKVAFYDVWDVIERQNALRYGRLEQNDMKAAVAQKLLDVINDGVTDREEIVGEVLSRLGVERS
jgi:hypothetical protein